MDAPAKVHGWRRGEFDRWVYAWCGQLAWHEDEGVLALLILWPRFAQARADVTCGLCKASISWTSYRNPGQT